MRTFLCDIGYHDPATGVEDVLRFGTVAYRTEPTDTPANAVYRERAWQPATLGRHAFKEGASFGSSQLAYGAIELANGDGDLDGLRAYGFAGRRVVIRAGDSADAFSAFVTILTGSVEGVEVTNAIVRVRIRSKELELLIPLQPNKYAGDNVLPDGLEGTADDLKGKPKPICLGVAKNVPAVLVNAAKLIYQVHDGPVNSVDVVYDQGIPLVVGVTEWEEQTHGFGAGELILGVAYGNGMHVAVGGNGKLYSSPDAVTWTSRTSGFTADTIWGVAYGGALFVAVGAAGKLTTSPDGITWTARTSSFAGGDIINAVAYNGTNLWVAVGYDGATTAKLASSPDGITWTQRTSPFSGAITGVAYGNSIWVIGGSDGQMGSSDDGITWTLRSQHPFVATETVENVAFGDGLFVAVGGLAGTSSALAISVDGLIWSERSTDFGTNTIFAAAYGNGFFVVGGQSSGAGAKNMAFSRDGAAWTMVRNTVTDAINVQGIAWGDDLFVCVGTGKIASTKQAGGIYADEADLLDDTLAPAPGTFKVYPEGGYFRLGALPAGLITADVTEGVSAKYRSPAEVFRRVLWQPWVVNAPIFLWSEDDLDALYTALAHEIGFFTAEEVTLAQVLDLIAMSAGAWWGANSRGVIRTAQFTAPSGSAVLSLSSNQVIGLERLPTADVTRGIPPWRSIVRWGRLYVVQTTDVAGGVTDARRGELAREWREAVAEDATVQTVHLLAPQVVEDSLLATEAGAQAEATRRQALRGTLRDVFQFRAELNARTEALELGDVIDLTHDRFGLTNGELCRVIGIEPNARDHDVRLTVFK